MEGDGPGPACALSEELSDHKSQKGEEASESKSSAGGSEWKKPSHQSAAWLFLSTCPPKPHMEGGDRDTHTPYSPSPATFQLDPGISSTGGALTVEVVAPVFLLFANDEARVQSYSISNGRNYSDKITLYLLM